MNNRYEIIIGDITNKKIENYLTSLKNKDIKAGDFLIRALHKKDIFKISFKEFTELLINTKIPRIYAESEVSGDGSDWNQEELSILGDISISVNVKIYDNALHYHPQIYKNTIKGYLIYTPGVLLRNDKGKIAPDWNEVITDDKLDFNSYYSLYERRLFPVFEYINAISKDKKAFITIPGLGCGQFAGKFQGQLGAVFKNVLVKLLENHGMKFSNIKAVYYDPYSECINERFEINNISLLVRPLLQSNENKPQLCEPSLYQENNDDFNDTELFSIVAWDHVSWPGNDFYDNSRATDDGVKAAATDSMFKITGVEGAYNIETNKYTAPKKYKNWEDVVYQNNIKLKLLN